MSYPLQGCTICQNGLFITNPGLVYFPKGTLNSFYCSPCTYNEASSIQKNQHCTCHRHYFTVPRIKLGSFFKKKFLSSSSNFIWKKYFVSGFINARISVSGWRLMFSYVFVKLDYIVDTNFLCNWITFWAPEKASALLPKMWSLSGHLY